MVQVKEEMQGRINIELIYIPRLPLNPYWVDTGAVTEVWVELMSSSQESS